MISDVSPVSNPFAVLSLIAAPAVLTNAASVLAMSTSNRFLRASERMRSLAARLDTPLESEALRTMLFTQVQRVETQAVLLLSGLRGAYVALGSFASACLISIVGAALSVTEFAFVAHLAVFLALAVGFVGAGGLVQSCYRLFRATRLSMMNITEEAHFIRGKHTHAALPPPASNQAGDELLPSNPPARA